jgi:hypothetical protein
LASAELARRGVDLVGPVIDGHTGVVVAPSEPEGTYRHVEFIRLRGAQVLIIFVTNTGAVQNKIIDLDERISQHELNAFGSYIDKQSAAMLALGTESSGGGQAQPGPKASESFSAKATDPSSRNPSARSSAYPAMSATSG